MSLKYVFYNSNKQKLIYMFWPKSLILPPNLNNN